MSKVSFGENDTHEISLELQKAFNVLDLQQDLSKQKRLAEYAKQILKWNKTYNLTAIKNLHDVYTQHLYDSLSVIKPIENYVKKQNIEKVSIFDVGSGAGLPGVVISIMCPQIKVICIDSVGKKVAFVKHVASMLGLTNLSAQHQRIESWQTDPVHIVISRAFTSLINFIDWAGKHVQSNGQMIAMKAHLSKEELEAFDQQNTWQINHIESLVVPNMHATRCLVWINKKERPDDEQQ
jgi:16S rRNA (guanine527-N7)-methyltransferase